jgi:chromosomal replication initiation ATPase DnaA
MIDELISRAAEVFDVDRAEILSNSRRRAAVWARQAVALVAYERGGQGMGVEAIGQALGRDHTTIVYSKQVAAERAIARPEYAALLGDLYQAV